MKKLDKDILRDIVEWDTINWGRAINMFEYGNVDCCQNIKKREGLTTY